MNDKLGRRLSVALITYTVIVFGAIALRILYLYLDGYYV